MLISEESMAVADKFIYMLENDGFDKELPVNVPKRNVEYKTDEIEAYNKLLDTGIAKELLRL